MYIRFFQRLCFALVTITLSASMMRAQTSSEFWIKIRDDAPMGDTVTLYFGNHINATYGKDSLNPKIREGGACGDPFAYLGAVWLDIPGRTPVMYKYCGFYPYDFRGIPENTIRKDTFLFDFQHMDYSNANATIRWPKSEYLGARCDSMFLSGYNINVNMFQVDSLFIPNYQDNGINKLKIYKYGCKIIDAIGTEPLQAPTNFLLHQNYPNPFNPATTIEYQLPFTSRVKIKVYNLLGQTMSTLTDEIQQAGIKSATWDATDISSGVYFYKLEAVNIADPSKSFTQVRKMVLVR